MIKKGSSCGCGKTLSKSKHNRGKISSKNGKKSLKTKKYRGGSGYADQFKTTLSPCYDNTPKVGWHAGGSKDVGVVKLQRMAGRLPLYNEDVRISQNLEGNATYSEPLGQAYQDVLLERTVSNQSNGANLNDAHSSLKGGSLVSNVVSLFKGKKSSKK